MVLYYVAYKTEEGKNYDLKKNQVISIICENWLNIYDKISTLTKCNNNLRIMA